MQPTSWQEAFFLASSDILTRLANFLPSFFGALVVFVLGLVFARWGKALVVKILETLRLSAAVKKTGFEKFLKKAEVRVKIEEVFGVVVKWVIILVFSIAAANILGLTAVSEILNNILEYLPRVFSSVIVLVIGVLLAGVVESLIKGALGPVDIKTSRLFAKLGSYMVIIFAVLTAVNELGIAQSLVNTLITGFIAMLALGFGLALGLGAKDIVSEALGDWYQGFKKGIKK